MRDAREQADRAREALTALYGALRGSGCGAPASAPGQLIRPVLSLAGAEALGTEADDVVWSAIAAVQLAHEASLLHDDVIDGAATRRSLPTLAAERGIAAALVEGDHLLTTAYRLAAATGSLQFASAFAVSVERTVAGEKLQGRAAGQVLDETTYRRIVGMKSGELLGCALAAAPLVRGAPCAEEWYVLGRRIGTLYQMLDDVLDYCPAVDTGKPALGDYRQRRWTWPLLHAPGLAFGLEADDAALHFAAPDAAGESPLDRCAAAFDDEARRVRAALAALMPGDRVIGALIDDWCARVGAAVRAAGTGAERAAARAFLLERLAALPAAAAVFSRGSRSFSFAARAFPRAFREQVAELYAFCRFTDDLADSTDALPVARRLAVLDEWESIARDAYHGRLTGHGLPDRVMSAAAAAGVPFRYAEELVEGMRMDVRAQHYATLDELRTYSYRVAGVIGQWLTRMCGVHDDGTLERAAMLGHAMQLTNILRDVGEDLKSGRVYIPAAVLFEHGITPAQLEAAADGAAPPARYGEMLEQLMAVADRDYGAALEATPALPRWFRGAVLIAAHVYRGIHDGIRANGFDNLTRRASTSSAHKVRLAWRALTGSSAMVPQRLHGARAAAAARRVAPGTVRALLAPFILAVASGGAGVAAQNAARPPAVHLAEIEAAAARAPGDTAIALDHVRALFFTAVEEEPLVEQGRLRVEALRRELPGYAERHAALLLAYEGAFVMLQAKHGSWPHARLRAVRRGLARLDHAVELAPADAEVRYLRLVNTHYLPGIFGRRADARADMRVLARLLPDARPSLPPDMYRTMAAFVDAQGTRP
jgi:15-cis-phytoene synthase